ncbi:hypothetical protein [Echinicola shivajiensis]|uniref:hypothetical protein n=1 Tax=Echinicola shivajiensis TaxID=1035916 RepID=UPI001BFC6F2B|nr:hypothetical protein [Echinicola shivajiensis]
MKKISLLVFTAALLFSSDLLAQDTGKLDLKSDLPAIFDFEPIEGIDSLNFSKESFDLSIPIMSKNISSNNKVEFIDPNMRILNLSKSFKGSIRVLEVPEDYHSRMPIIKLRESNVDDAILLPKK